VYTKRYDVYRVSTGAGDTQAVVHGASMTVAIPDVLRDSAIRRGRAMLAHYPISNFDPADVPHEFPEVRAIAVDDQRRLWVLRPSSDVDRSIFDVYAATDERLASALVPSRIVEYAPLIIRRGSLYLLTLDQDGIEHITRYGASSPLLRPTTHHVQ
jgi:hypothetical protein